MDPSKAEEPCFPAAHTIILRMGLGNTHTHTPIVLAAGASEIFDHQHAENLTNQNNLRAEQVPEIMVSQASTHPGRASQECNLSSHPEPSP